MGYPSQVVDSTVHTLRCVCLKCLVTNVCLPTSYVPRFLGPRRRKCRVTRAENYAAEKLALSISGMESQDTMAKMSYVKDLCEGDPDGKKGPSKKELHVPERRREFPL